MANVGYTGGQNGGSPWPSNARTTGRVSSTDGAEGLVEGSKVAHEGMVDNDPLDTRADWFAAASEGQVCTD